jgi:hypothetical protein
LSHTILLRMVCELVSYRTVRVGTPSVYVAVGDIVQESAAYSESTAISSAMRVGSSIATLRGGVRVAALLAHAGLAP